MSVLVIESVENGYVARITGVRKYELSLQCRQRGNGERNNQTFFINCSTREVIDGWL